MYKLVGIKKINQTKQNKKKIKLKLKNLCHTKPCTTKQIECVIVF